MMSSLKYVIKTVVPFGKTALGWRKEMVTHRKEEQERKEEECKEKEKREREDKGSKVIFQRGEEEQKKVRSVK